MLPVPVDIALLIIAIVLSWTSLEFNSKLWLTLLVIGVSVIPISLNLFLINRLKLDFNVGLYENLDDVKKGDIQIEITNASGAIVQKEEIDFMTNPTNITTNNLPTGSYYVTLSGEKGSFTKKLIISN